MVNTTPFDTAPPTTYSAPQDGTRLWVTLLSVPVTAFVAVFAIPALTIPLLLFSPVATLTAAVTARRGPGSLFAWFVGSLALTAMVAVLCLGQYLALHPLQMGD